MKELDDITAAAFVALDSKNLSLFQSLTEGMEGVGIVRTLSEGLYAVVFPRDQEKDVLVFLASLEASLQIRMIATEEAESLLEEQGIRLSSQFILGERE